MRLMATGMVLLSAMSVAGRPVPSKGAITCVGPVAGSTDATSAGTYTSSGTFRGSCAGGSGTESFTARFHRSDGVHIVVGTHRFSTTGPLGTGGGDGATALFQIAPLGGGACVVGPVTSAAVLGEVFLR